MAIFGCMNPSAHDTLPRNRARPNRAPLAQVNGINRDRSAPAGQVPAFNANSPMARSMSRRNGNGAKLLKRSRVSKAMIGKPTDFQHVSHLNKDEAMGSKEMAEVKQALRQPVSSQSALPTTETMFIRNPSEDQKDVERTERSRLSEDESRHSLDQPSRRPTINKRKAPPPITPSIIKAAGLPPSLATKTTALPFSPSSPAKTLQGLRATPVKLKAKRQSKVPIVPEANPHDRTELDGLGGLSGGNPLDGLSSVPEVDKLTTAATELLASPSPAPTRSTTLQNLALSESMENVVKHAEDMSSPGDNANEILQPPRSVGASPSGPLAYMTDSTKIRWNNGMAEIAMQLKQQS